jgi:hypothetical protein
VLEVGVGGESAVDRGVLASLAGSAAASAAYTESAADLMTAPGLAWRWVVRTDALDLYAVANPVDVQPVAYDRHLTLIGGGGALHRARVALAADGVDVAVTFLPDEDPDHLATLIAVGPIEVTAEARERYAATDRRDPATGARARTPIRGRTDVPPAQEELATSLVRSAMAEGVGISVREEDGSVIAVLYGPDTTEAWLRAGEAVSAVRLEAARFGREAVPTVAGRERPRDENDPEQPTTVEDRRRDRDSVVYVHLYIGPVEP